MYCITAMYFKRALLGNMNMVKTELHNKALKNQDGFTMSLVCY